MGKKKDKAPQRLPHSTPGHLQSIDHAVAIAMALPSSLVRRPDMPVSELLRDARSVAAAVAVHDDALVDRGLSPSLGGELVARADALSQAQAMWLADRRRGLKKDATAIILKDAEDLRDEASAVIGLALRKSRDGQVRLGSIGIGEGIADVIGDLMALSQLAADADFALEAVNENPAVLCKRLDKARKAVEGALADASAGRVVSGSKDVRDRLAVLVDDAVDEIRAFAAVAFRTDTTNERRGAFASLSLRRRRPSA